MAEFATELRINNNKDIQDLCELVCRWILGMKHTRFSKSTLRIDSQKSLSDTIDCGREVVEMRCARNEEVNFVGISYTNTDEDGITWVSEVVGSKSKEFFSVSIRVYRHSSFVKKTIPNPRRPHLMKMFMDGDWQPHDGVMPLLSSAYFVKDGEQEVVSNLLDCKFDNKLPVIYVSILDGIGNKYLINTNSLAFKLGCIAHVVVEPTVLFSREMRKIFGERSVRNGDIGIFWPEEAGVTVYSRRDGVGSALIDRISHDVMVAISNRRSSPDLTFQYVQELFSKNVISALKEAGSRDIEEYIHNFDAEISAKDKQLSAAEYEISRLKESERNLLSRKRSVDAQANLSTSVESDLYFGEILEFILDALENSKKSCDSSYRRYHVMSDLIESNRGYGAQERLRQKIKDVFREYDGMSKRMERELIDIGFSVEESGKHIKIIFKGDSRYQFTIPKTPSDYRGSQNMISDITKKLIG